MAGTISRNKLGQNITEYLILVAGVLVVVILAANPRGIFTRGVNRSIDMMFDSVEDMATVQCLGTIDTVNGQWSDYNSWTSCAACSQTRTRTCDSPAPECNGAPCTLTDGTQGLMETETQSCYSGSWVTGACGVCTGACGSTAGTCTQAVTCSGGCCDPATEPSSTASCTKPPYPDVWSALGFGACSVSCDAGISSQTVTCSGMCCDAALKPPTRRACTEGCCAQSLYIGYDVENDVNFTATFGPAASGESDSAGCPPGYAGIPTRTCTATASGSCTGNDSYVPPASCYTIGWGGLTGECQPADCPAVSVDAGYGRTWNISGGAHDTTAVLTCSDGGWSYTGTASYECWLGAWRNLNAGCVPNCSEQTLDVGAGQTGLFLEAVDGATATSVCPCGYQGNPQRPCDKGVWGDLIPGTECTIRHCGPEKFTVFTPPAIEGTFSADQGETDTQNCNTIDSRLDNTGTASMTCDWCVNPLNGWTNPDYQCTARNCDTPYTPTVDGVTVRFDPAGHGIPQTVTCEAFSSNTYTGSVSSQCCFGTWIDPGLGCTGSEPQGYSGGCRSFACQTTYMSPPVTNASSCGDDTSLTADEDWSVVDDCTSAKTCEWACNSTFKKSGNACVDTVCTGGGFGGASPCGTQKPPDDMANWLNPSTCSSSIMCEYYCPNPSVYYDPLPTGDPYCCTPACPLGSCGNQNNATTCGIDKDCGDCCGNGALDAGEQCDPPGASNPNGNTCSSRGYTGTGGPLGCNNDCTFNESTCCNAVDGTWGAPWTVWSDPAGFPDGAGGTCSKACGTGTQSRTGTCNGASCGGTCPGSSTQTQDCNTQACCVPKTCADLGLCSGSTPTSDGCSGTINCGACPAGTWQIFDATGCFNCSANPDTCPGDFAVGGSCTPLGSTCSRCVPNCGFPNGRVYTFQCQ